MLSKEENDLVCRVGPGTVMGNLMREYWIPALLSSELPKPDSDPVRVMLLGEKLIAFRDTEGRVGLLNNFCPHRGASLFYGRTEGCGLRCVYHGWQFDVNGQCIDMPNEPATSDFKEKVRAPSYRCEERGGIVWAYMGPRQAAPPPLPDIEANNLPDGEWSVSAISRECNWLQSLEGDIDTSHFSFLHFGAQDASAAKEGTFLRYMLEDRAPRYSVLDTDYGAMYGAYRPAEPGTYYWRIAQFLFPFYAMIPTGVLGNQVLTRAWVPMDDHHTMYYGMLTKGRAQTRNAQNPAGPGGFTGLELLPNTTDWFGRFRMASNADNDFRLDRDFQRNGSYTGIAGVFTEDQAVTESMDPIYDRTQEHLGSSDAMVIRVRRRLLAVARELAEQSKVPYSADHPEVYRQRSGGIVLPEDADWIRSTEELRKAYVAHPELDPTVAGR